MSVNNPDCSPFNIESLDPVQAKTGIMEMVSDYFPILELQRCLVIVRVAALGS